MVLNKLRTLFPISKNLIRVLLLIVGSGLAFIAINFSTSLRPSAYPLQLGEVSPQSIQAPRTLIYTSEVLTDQARKEAEMSIPLVYLPADPAISRSQIERLRNTLNFVTAVRSDSFGTTDQKLSDLEALADVQLSKDIAERVLALNDTRWQTIQQEALGVLERAMRGSIREDQLEEVQKNVPTLISLSLAPDQATIVAEFVTPFVIPNSLFSQEQTQQNRQEAAKAVEPVTRTFVEGETVVQRGQIITPAIWEALTQFGLIQPQRDKFETLSAAILVILLATFVSLYFNRTIPALYEDIRGLAVIVAMFLVFLIAARLIIPNRTVIPYLFPLAAFGLTVASLYKFEIGLVFSILLSVLAAYELPYSLDLTLYYALPSLCGILVLGQGRRVASFIWAGVAIGFAGSAVVLAYRIPDVSTDWVGIATLVGASLFNGLASTSLALIFQFLFSQLLGLTTALQLLEISRPDHPLLQIMLQNTSGSYQHSLQVANLAEQAAKAIGADALLVRAGAIYHDAGKTTNPFYFIENQVPGMENPHEKLNPETSAALIIRHVTDGVQLARKHRLPPRILDFIREHHGTLLTRYQYSKALQAAGNKEEMVDPELFRYPGPRPGSRETALLMLADGCEAITRAELPKDEVGLRALVKKVFDYCQQEGQLDGTELTLRDLNLAMESFISTLKNTHHLRIRYPEIISAQNAADEKRPQTQPVVHPPSKTSKPA